MCPSLFQIFIYSVRSGVFFPFSFSFLVFLAFWGCIWHVTCVVMGKKKTELIENMRPLFAFYLFAL